MPFAPRGLLVGIIQVSGLSPNKLAEARIELALEANELGYGLVETFEVIGDEVKDEGTYAALEDLSSKLDVQAVMVSGDVDLERVEEIGERVRMLVIKTGANNL